MTAKIEALRQTRATGAEPPSGTPQRQQLADAIERQRAATEALARVEQAKARAHARWNAADDAIEAARAHLAEIREAEPHRLVAALMAGDEAGGGEEPLREAEAALGARQRDEANMGEAYRLLDIELSSARAAVSRAHDGVDAAVAGVVAADPAVAALVAEYQAARRRVADLSSAMYEVSRANGLPAGLEHWYADPSTSPLTPLQPIWREAIQRLREDALAPLPLPTGDAPSAA
jgi:hypothetical protein